MSLDVNTHAGTLLEAKKKKKYVKKEQKKGEQV